VDTLQAKPPSPDVQYPEKGTTGGFNQTDAAQFKAEIFKGIAKEVKRFEAMIAA
jgi:hypothetical protein